MWVEDTLKKALICSYLECSEGLSPEISLILLSAPAAMGYYPKVGFTAADNAFIIQRERSSAQQ
jgi:hypothetical protein